MSTFLLTGIILPLHADGPLVNARYMAQENTALLLQYLDHNYWNVDSCHVVDSITVWEELVRNKPWPLRKAMFSGP
jgi:hypothetical protein